MKCTYTEVVGGLADLIAIGAITGRIAGQLLLLAPASAKERFVQGGDNRVALQLAITGRVGGKCDVRLVLQERVVPAADGKQNHPSICKKRVGELSGRTC